MRFTFIFLFAVLVFSACSNLETVENKDGNDAVTERFTINKKSKMKEGNYFSFYPNGQKLEESVYINDSLQGERKLFFENGQVESISNHANSMFVGKYQKFDENGKLTNEGQYANNEMSGNWKRWYDTGELQEEVSFEANMENGPFKEYHKNGKLKTEGVYLNGDNEQGELKIYDENGVLTQKMYCDYGVCSAFWTKENGDTPLDTTRLRKLAEMKKQSMEIE